MRATSDLLSRSVLALVLATLLIGGAAAQTLTVEDGDKVIWNTSDSNAERTLNAGLACDSGSGNITVFNDGYTLVPNQSAPLNENLGFSEVKDLGEYTVKGYCNQSSSTESIYIAEMNPEIVQPGNGMLAYRRHFMGDELDKGNELYKGKPVVVDLSITGLEGFNPDTDSDPSQNFGETGWRALQIERSDLSFDVSIPSGTRSLDMAPFKMDRSGGDFISQKVSLYPYIPADMSGGYKSVSVSTDYDGKYGGTDKIVETDGDAVYLTGVRTRDMNPDEDITQSQIGSVNMRLYVEPGYTKYVSESSFELRVEDPDGSYSERPDVDFSLSEVQGSDNVYRLELEEVPSELPDSNRFDMDIMYQDPEYPGQEGIEIASYNVFADYVRFEGYVWDSQTQPVNGQFRVDGRSFSTDSMGRFAQKFVPGEYGFDISLAKGSRTASLNLNDVEMKSEYEPSNTKIRYEYVDEPGGINVPGVDPMDLVSFVFRKPFTKAGSSVTIDYSVSGSDPTEVSVFGCDNWAMASSECLSRWEKMDDTSFSPGGGWSVTVPATTFEANYLGESRQMMRSAYVIGTRSGLRLNGPLTVKGATTGRAVAGSELTFGGQFVSAGATQVDNANVTVSLLEDETAVESFEGQTGSDGSFSISGEVPEEPGNYTLRLSAEKEPYDPYTTTPLSEPVWVYREEELTLTKKTEDRWELQPGEQTRKTLVVENTGQETLQDITLEITGTQSFNRNYVSLATSDIGTLQPGDTREVDLVFDIPDSCPTTGCSEFSSSVDLEVSGDGVSATLDVGPQIMTSSGSTGTDTDTRDAEQRNETGDGLGFSDIPGARATGQFLAAQSTLNIALGLMLMFLMVLAGALKSKGDGDAVRRNVVRNSGGGSGRSSSRPGVQPPRVSPAHDDSEPLDSPKSVAGSSSETGEDEDGQEAEEEPSDEDSGGHGKVDKLASRLSGSGEDSGGEEPSGETDEQSGEDPGSSVECDVCGEEFDTQAGVELHKKTAH